MITALELTRFGKFTGRRFALSQTTLFVGPNESGKTTIFHALLECLCRPKGTSISGRELTRRYTERRSAAIEPAPPEPPIDVDEFLNLFAITAGSISLHMPPGGGNWVDRVKAELFSGGIDPQELAAQLEKEASDKGSLSHMRKREEIRRSLEKEEKQLTDLNRLREEILNQERNGERARLRLGALEQELENARAEYARHEEVISQQEFHEQRDRQRGTLELLATVRRLRKEEAEVKQILADGEGAATETEKTVGDAQREVEEKKGNLQSSQRQLEAERRQLAERAVEVKQSQADAEVAAQLRRNLESKRQEEKPVVIHAIRVPVLIGAVLSAAAAVASALLLPVPWSAVGAAAGGVVAILLGIFSRKSLYHRDEAAETRAVRRVCEEWQQRRGSQMNAVTYEGAFSFLTRVEGEAEHHRDEHARLEDAVAAREEQVRSTAVEAEKADETLTRARAARQEWLSSRGVTTMQHYWERRAEAKQTAEALAEAEDRLDAVMRAYRVDNEDQLESEAARLQKESEAHIDGERFEAWKVENARRRLEELQKVIANGEAERNNLTARVSELRGGVRARLGELPARIAETQRHIDSLQRDIDELDTAREAAGVAAEIFREMAEDSTEMLRELSQEIALSYRAVTRTELRNDDRAVVGLSQFDVKSAEVVDAEGTARPLDNLSQGTRDIFLFCSRLVLASKARTGAAVLVLDDPFQAIDEARSTAALKLLRHFQEKQGWQLVLFSRDEALEAKISAIFEDVRTYHLERGAAAEP